MNQITSTDKGETAIEFRPMQSADLQGGLRLSTGAGWNQKESDWKLFYSLNKKGAFVASHGNQVVGTVTTTNYEGKMGWIGMVLVDPAYRGRGIATHLLNLAIESLSHLDTILLDATPAGRHVYTKLGFEDGFNLTRMIAPGGSTSPEMKEDALRPMRADDIDFVARWDGRVLGANRRSVLEHLLKTAPEYAWVYQHPSESIHGFVLGRHGTNFEQIGPLFANDIEIAIALYNRFLKEAAGKAVGMDVPDTATDWVAFLQTSGMKAERPFTRMYLGGKFVCTPDNALLAIAGPELG